MDIAVLDQARETYKAAVEQWIAAIRHEEDLASAADHSETDIDAWEHAHDAEEKARKHAKSAKSDYEDVLRKKFFNF